MSGLIDGNKPEQMPVTNLDDETKRRAARTVASMNDREDVEEMLDALGLLQFTRTWREAS